MPNGVGNLQKGERYANMDYIIASAMSHFHELRSVGLSYDICCQWYPNMYQQMTGWPEQLHILPMLATWPLIPKFHEPAHNEKAHEQYSFNLAVGFGKSDGEVPERGWAGHNGLGNTTKMQGPGSRHDVLDDHFGSWNWVKYHTMGASLIQKYKAAVIEQNRQTEAHRGFTESLPGHLVKDWDNMCVVWEEDGFPKTKPNPYELKGARMTEAKPSGPEDEANIPVVPEERHRRDGTGQTHFSISWIWRVEGANVAEAEDGGDYSSLRLEWAQSRAHAQCCKEELQLLLEEMRRMLDFLKYKADWWENEAMSRMTASPELREGLSSYAASQADVQTGLASSFVWLWRKPLDLVKERQVDKESQAAAINLAEQDMILDDNNADGDGGDDDDDGETSDDNAGDDATSSEGNHNSRAGGRSADACTVNVHLAPMDAEAAFF
ncbi:hypothetical protein HYPSUDRAFT_208168 [Hypholoma sublateritium FD-334 SS-4]|uniref:Uncharacterized protein n=1 Tax=Hypholoma sublateritium (strain FD-334 SS-4) TaxID=945553 RepID=A0A0D2KKC9_HYPSF|nr:hypothetical protein HYPSUDRAFT_208168 [Hypholoma sublateritium FD-334 SS-4]